MMSSHGIEACMKHAVQLHQQGRLAEAKTQYEAVLGMDPASTPARHNLGMVLIGLGRLRPGVELVEQVMVQAPPFPERSQSYREVGLSLYRHGYWEQARPWLEQAFMMFPNDFELKRLVDRGAPRDYLVPEVFDPVAGEVLLRYSPREAENYIYVVEIVGGCNLSCPTCPVGNLRSPRQVGGRMELGLFKRIIDRIVQDKPCEQAEVWLFNWGEPLLHPDLPTMIEYTRTNNLICQLSTNLNITSGLEEVIGAQPNVLKVSISGFTAETYGLTHRGGDLQLVRDNLFMVSDLLEKTGVPTKVWVGHHLYRSTAGQSEVLRGLCVELGFFYHPIQAFFQPVENLVRIMQGELNSENTPILEDLLVHPRKLLTHIQAHRSTNYDCELRFNQTVINPDGSVALCCNVYEEENMLGVHFLDSTPEQLQGLRYSHPFCKTCRGVGADYSVSELPETINPGDDR